MSGAGGRLAHLARTLMLIGLLGANVGLIALNLHKHQWFPFDETGGAVNDGAEDRINPTPDSQSTSTGATGLGEAVGDYGVDDWPGGRGPLPVDRPIARQVQLRSDGTVTLSGSAPSWAVATEIAADLGAQLSRDPNDPVTVTVDMSWHPGAPAQTSGGAVGLDPPIIYPSGQVAVPDVALADLDFAAALLNEHPSSFAVVVAHIDDLGDSDENAAVAAARASAVTAYLESQGVIRSRVVVVVAPEDPAGPPNDTEEGRAFNRRVEIRFENLLAGTVG